MKYVIARARLCYNDSDDSILTIGKRYEVEKHVSYQNNGNGIWITEELIYNPTKASFYIKIKEDDNGNTHDIWNDYFLSSEEIREINLNKIGI